MTKLPADAKVELDTTPTGAFGQPRWQYDIRAAAACLEAEPPLSPSYRKSISDMLGRHERFIAAALEQSDAEQGEDAEGSIMLEIAAATDEAQMWELATKNCAACIPLSASSRTKTASGDCATFSTTPPRLAGSVTPTLHR
jgi:hypothetical protein